MKEGILIWTAVFSALAWSAAGSQEISEERLRELRRQNPIAVPIVIEIHRSMLSIPGGTFQMGYNALDEKPEHPVRIRPFKLAKYEVTFAQYDVFALVTERPLKSDESWGRERRPVIHVSWEDASAFAAWLSKVTGHRYRLPSEAEWEYAMRGGTTSSFHWGSVPLDSKDFANIRPNLGGRDVWDFTAPVGQFQPNPFGLYDMAGNVYEWTIDCYHASYVGAPQDGSAWTAGDCSNRVLRGGSFREILAGARSARRYHRPPADHDDHIGFRLASSPSD